MLEAELYSYLQSQASITLLVAKRIRPGRIHQSDALPAISYRRVTAERVRDFGGDTGVALPRIEFSCWAKSYAGAKDLSDKLRLSLANFRGDMGELFIHGAYMVSEIDLFDEPEDASDSYTYRVVQDYDIWSEETVASP